MSNKRITIYDVAKGMNLSVSYISKALNNHPTINEKMKEAIKQKAKELNYKHNAYAANLRRGKSKTIGVVIPYINSSFFSEAIAGIEEVCAAQNYGLIICQSHDSYEKECEAIDTLIGQNVECILISVAAATRNSNHLQHIVNNDITVIQFDRFTEDFDSFMVINDNEGMAYNATNHLISKGYKRIAFLGGTEHLSIFKLRKKGYLKALKKANISIVKSLIFDDALSKEKTVEITRKLLSMKKPPDALFAVTDYQALNALLIAESLGVKSPEQFGIIGAGNDNFTEITKPALSAIEQYSHTLGKKAAELYFEQLNKEEHKNTAQKMKEIVPFKVIARESTDRGTVTINKCP